MHTRTMRMAACSLAAGLAALAMLVPAASAAPTSAPGISGTCSPLLGPTCTPPQIAGPTELISNGGFEYLFSNWFWSNPDPWRLTGGAADVGNSSLAHSGTAFIEFGTIDGTLTQQFTI